MAPAASRAQKPVGSAPWLSAEKENIVHMVDEEMEEVQYPITHEINWLNEHMGEVFDENQFNLTEVFKTPGKLRGKTPRTARKRNADESRVPLGEIFSSTRKQSENKPTASPSFHRSPPKLTAAKSTTTASKPADSPENASHPHYPDLSQNLNSFPQFNTDSGYHGMPDNDVVLPDARPESPEPTQPLESQQIGVDDHAHRSSAGRATNDSFHSAQENVRRGGTVEPMNVNASPMHKIEVQVPKQSVKKNTERDIKDETARLKSGKYERHQPDIRQPEQEELPPRTAAKEDTAQLDHEQDGDDDASENKPLDNLEDIGSPSDESSPDRPLIRKSSLTFASLPAREPLTKKSLGGPGICRTSHVGAGKPSTGGSGFGRQTGSRSTHAAVDEDAQDDKMDVDAAKEAENDSEAGASKLHSKSSTQRLHEKISMLGKSQPSRPTKSIPSSQVAYPDLPAAKPDTKPEPSSQKAHDTPAPEATEAENDDWIKPLDSPRPTLRKSQTMDVMDVDRDGANDDQMDVDDANGAAADGKSSPPQTRQKSMSVSNVPDGESTTPIGSPERRDGPLSASKSRLQSIMKSAKGLFSSTGGASTGAKVVTSSPDEPRIARNRASTHTAGIGKERPQNRSSSPVKEGRRTRSSTEREERRKQKETEDCRDEEQSRLREAAVTEKSSVESEARPASARRLPQPQRQVAKEPEPADTGTKSAVSHPSSQPSKPADRRPVKPTREAVQKPKPQPVSIRVGSALSRQMPLASSSLSSSVHESNTPAPPASNSKQQTAKKKPSSSSLHTAPSNNSFKSSASSQSQRKAQLASERKKEQEEREARRKEEQKRELERKRAAQQEEARRQEMRNRAEAERKERERAAVEDSKKTAQMQAIEKRRLENSRRIERQGSQQSSEPEKSAQRDMGTARPTSRLGSAQPYGRAINQPQPNPAKPPKRGLEDEARPARKPSATIQPSGEAKRRRTEEEQNPMAVRPTMAPPIRQSNIRKEPTKPSFFGHQPSGQPGSSLKTAQPQRPGHPMDMAKYTTGKIPFAEPSNAGPSQSHKTTPANSSQKTRPSPKYPNGENIALPEIATDSEDEDSDAEMRPVPKWAQPKELEALLRDQEGMEVDSIFGPFAPFSLEEAFKSDKKLKKFRERTSSANWSGPDALTQDEIKKDLSERQRMKLNGGWSFNG